ncbi:VOC family protein [Candidatus Entotheonella serta]|nr:VOC family protein [Candidatus Entotheonella serta]
MSDPRPDIAIGHVRLAVSNVTESTEFFVKLGIRTIVEQDDFSVLELRGGFDIMVDDIDAAYAQLKGYGMEVSDISRGRIHDNFEVQTPDRRALMINSSHAGDRAV